MKLDNEGLRDLYRQATSRAVRSGCPSSDALAAAALGEAPPDATEQIARHLESCAECADEYRIAAALKDWAKPDARPAPRPVTARRAAGSWLALAASLAAVAVGLSALWPGDARESTDDATRRAAVPSEAVELVAPTGPTRLESVRFEWKPVAGADAYRVHVFSRDGLPVWTSAPTRETSLSPQASVSFRTGGHLWHVTATRNGEVVARSKVIAFTIGE